MQRSGLRRIRAMNHFVTLLFSSRIPLHVVLLFAVTLVHPSDARVVLPENVTVPAVFVFGDSLVDTGNNNHLLTVLKSNFPPYGRDFVGGAATGRFGNGKIPSDIVVEEFGIKEILPAFLDPYLSPEELPTGVSFASSGTGFDPLTSILLNLLSMSDQLQLFSQYKRQLQNRVGARRAQHIVANSLYFVASGSNDLIDTYFHTPFEIWKYDLETYTDLLRGWASAFFQGLYELGARRISFLGLAPLGCLPFQRTVNGGLDRVCVELFNNASELFNSKVVSTMQALSTTLPQVRFSYADCYGALTDMTQAPHKYGFKVVDRGCCGTGLVEATFLCNRWSLGTCSNASEFLFWDSYHLTERAYRILIHKVMGKIIQDLFQP